MPDQKIRLIISNYFDAHSFFYGGEAFKNARLWANK